MSTPLQTLSQESQAAKTIFKALAERQRFRRKTDLDRLYRSMSDTLSFEEFRGVFKKMQDIGVGSLIIGRKNNPDRFAWNYSLKDVAQAAHTGNSLNELHPLPKKAGRPFSQAQTTPRKSSPEPQGETKAPMVAQHVPMIQITFMVPATAPKADIEALIDLAKELNK